MSFMSFLKGLFVEKKCTCCNHNDIFVTGPNNEPYSFTQSNKEVCECVEVKIDAGDKVATMTNFSEMLDEVKPVELLSVTVSTEIVDKPKKKVVKKKVVKKKSKEDKTDVKPKVKSKKTSKDDKENK